MKAIINIKDFKRVLIALKPFIKKTYQTTEKMSYIYLNTSKERQEIEFQATDGHKAAREIIKADVTEDFQGYIKPTKLYSTTSNQVEIELRDNFITVSTEEWTMKHKQLDGKWYYFNSMLDMEYKESRTVVMDAKLLSDALHGISKNCNRERIELTLGDRKEPVSIKTSTGTRLVLPLAGGLNNETNN